MAINYQDCWTYPKEKIDQLIGKAIQYKDGTVTAETGVTASETRIAQRGCTVEVNFMATLSAAVGSSQKKLATISGVDMPSDKTRVIVGTGATHGYEANHVAYCILDPADGSIQVLAGTNTDKIINVHFVYNVD